MTELAALLIPSLRWDPAHAFTYLADTIDDALELGVGGFVVHGGPIDAVMRLTEDLHGRSRIPLLLAADTERGAGQQFHGCIGLPPASAVARQRSSPALGLPPPVIDPSPLTSDFRRCASTTARELKLLGLNWSLAPVCDLDLEPGCAIVGTRALGAAAAAVSPLLEEWIDACQAEGVLACAKHFPGHGRAAEDSHRTLPVVRARAGQLALEDLVPFRAAIDAGVASVMTAHVAFPALDARGAPATLSAPILRDLLRHEFAFDGLVASSALEMDALRAAGDEADVAVRAITAGCDVLLAPMDLPGAVRALERAALQGALGAERIRDALARRERWAQWARPTGARETTIDDVMWARQLADRCVGLVRGTLPRIGSALEIVEVDDDAGGAWRTPSRSPFAEALRALDLDAPLVPEPTTNTRVPVVITAYADVIAWKGTAGFGPASVERIARTVAAATAAHRDTLLVLFSHARHAAQVPTAPNVLCAWGGEPPMQAAAARVLARG